MEQAHNTYRPIGDTMPALGLAFWMTGERRFVAAAQKWIGALLAVPDWRGSSNLGRSSWTMGCALLYDWLYEELNPELRGRLQARLIQEAEIICETAAATRALSNHLLIEASAVGCVGLALRDEVDGAADLLDQADAWTHYIIDHAPLDGSWGEGVQYWQYGLGYFLRFLEAADTSKYRDYYAEYNWLKRTGYFPVYFSLPGRPTEMVNFSDCGSQRYIPAFLLFIPASRYREGYFQDYGLKVLSEMPHKFSWMDFIAYDPSVPARDIHLLPAVKHFSDHDFLTMRSGWHRDAMVIGFRSGPAPGHRNQQNPELFTHRGFGPGHQHPDINSFNIYAFGEWLAVDPGYTKRKETRNHNTLIVNGYGQAGAGGKWLDFQAFEKRRPAPAILRVESNPIFDYVIGDAGQSYVDEAGVTSFRRHLLYLKPDILIVLDDVCCERPSRIEWLLHAHDRIAKSNEDSFEIQEGAARLWVKPLLPAEIQAAVSDRELDASDTDGKIVTLNLQVEGVTVARYLVALSALENTTAPPVVSFSSGQLQVAHQGKQWQVHVLPASQIDDSKACAMVLEDMDPELESIYSFVRSEDE